MAYVEYYKEETEYQGESFIKSLYKKTKQIWDINEVGTYTLTDTFGSVLLNGNLVKSADKLSLTVALGSTDTASLLGVYKLLVYLEDTVNSELKDVLAEYKITYIETKATE